MSNCINIIENQGSHCGKKREIYAINSVVLDLNWKYQYEFMIYIIPTSMNLKSFKKNDKSQEWQPHPAPRFWFLITSSH